MPEQHKPKSNPTYHIYTQNIGAVGGDSTQTNYFGTPATPAQNQQATPPPSSAALAAELTHAEQHLTLLLERLRAVYQQKMLDLNAANQPIHTATIQQLQTEAAETEARITALKQQLNPK